MWTTKSSVVSYQILQGQKQDDYRDSIGPIFNFQSYPEFLRTWMKYKKSAGSKYSKRMIARRLNCDPSFFGKILSGKKMISPKLQERFSELLQLNKKEKEYFELLVQFEKSSSIPEKKFYLDRIARIRRTQVKLIDPDKYEFYSKWYYSAVLQLLDCLEFRDDYDYLARCVVPAIKPGEAKKAIEVLEQLELIRKNSEGFYEKTEAVISTGEGWKGVAIKSYQAETLDLARDALNKKWEAPKRFSTLTLSINEEIIQELLEKFKGLEMECLDSAKMCEKPDRVYQLNLQVFPVGHKTGEGIINA